MGGFIRFCSAGKILFPCPFFQLSRVSQSKSKDSAGASDFQRNPSLFFRKFFNGFYGIIQGVSQTQFLFLVM